MKTILIGALALTMAGASVAAAQPYGAGPGQPHGNPNAQGPGQPPGGGQGPGQPPGGGQHNGWGRDYGSGHHWRRGERVGYNDWNSARPVDYRQHHLRKPPRGYEWRESNGQYILAAVATGLIVSILLNSGH